MLAEIAAANAAFSLLKTALSNGKELYDCTGAATQFFDNKSVIAKRVADKGQSDMQAFMALEKIKEQEAWLKEYMIYAGRADMYNDWLQFQADAKRARAQEEKDILHAKAKHRKQMVEFFTVVCTALVAVPAIGGAVYIIFTILGSI
jgi:hypothetical protein|tara:strand:+ start:1691 stop:2131 length:441 start_codon:yes stop_codon:yes gene_type:complete